MEPSREDSSDDDDMYDFEEFDFESPRIDEEEEPAPVLGEAAADSSKEEESVVAGSSKLFSSILSSRNVHSIEELMVGGDADVGNSAKAEDHLKSTSVASSEPNSAASSRSGALREDDISRPTTATPAHHSTQARSLKDRNGAFVKPVKVQRRAPTVRSSDPSLPPAARKALAFLESTGRGRDCSRHHFPGASLREATPNTRSARDTAGLAPSLLKVVLSSMLERDGPLIRASETSAAGRAPLTSEQVGMRRHAAELVASVQAQPEQFMNSCFVGDINLGQRSTEHWGGSALHSATFATSASESRTTAKSNCIGEAERADRVGRAHEAEMPLHGIGVTGGRSSREERAKRRKELMRGKDDGGFEIAFMPFIHYLTAYKRNGSSEMDCRMVDAVREMLLDPTILALVKERVLIGRHMASMSSAKD